MISDDDRGQRPGQQRGGGERPHRAEVDVRGLVGLAAHPLHAERRLGADDPGAASTARTSSHGRRARREARGDAGPRASPTASSSTTTTTAATDGATTRRANGRSRRIIPSLRIPLKPFS